VKLFQIEEPDGTAVDPAAPGAAIGIDASGDHAEVAFAVGGNALILADREGYERALPVPTITAQIEEWQELLEGARIRAERALARPVTHAVIALGRTPASGDAESLHKAAALSGLEILRVVEKGELQTGSAPALSSAILAENLAPRPELNAAPKADGD
jgi:hypothetical protein